jgi:hypothetical protein
MADIHKNFAYSTVLTAPVTATAGTALTVQVGDGALFPTVPFNATVWPTSTQPTSTNAEIVRVTNITGDILTITRTQESSTNRSIVVGDQVAATVTNKTLTDAETLYVNLLGANTAGNTTASGSTIGLSGINLTLSGTNGSVYNISAPATSSLSATGGLVLSTNGSTISIGMPLGGFYEPYPLLNGNTVTFKQEIGSWRFMYLPVNLPIGSGRVNMLYSMTGSANMLAGSNGANWASNTTGGASWSFRLDRTVALYTRGPGASSTRLESIWSNTITNGISQSIGISVTNASQLTVARSVSLQYIQVVETNGLYTTAGVGATHNASYASSVTATTAHTSAISSIYNMLTGAMLVPIGFNTTISAGNYWMAIAYNTTATTAGSSVGLGSLYDQVNVQAMQGPASQSYRQFGATISNTSSQYLPGHGAVYSASSGVPPPTVPFTDLRSQSNNAWPYVNIIQSVAS